MLFNKLITYEVLVGEDNRWILDGEHGTKSNAMTRAQALFDASQHDSIRVIRLENDANEEVIFHKECTKRAEKPITISPIEEAAVCNEADDLTGFEARKTTGRLLRQYLDEWGITALELLHNHGNIRQLARMETLYGHALHRISSIQARALDEDPGERIDKLYRLASEVEDRTRNLEDTSTYLSLIKDKGLSTALSAIDRDFGEKRRPFFTAAVLAEYLSHERDWKKKISLVVGLLESETGEAAIVHLDQICAEILDGSDAVKDLLGPQADLFSALRMMSQLSTGSYKAGRQSDTPLGRFNAVMKNQSMPFSQGILLERVARSLSGTNALTRGNDETDRTAFIELFNNLISYGGMLGGVAISDAVTRRIRLTMRKGDSDLSPGDGIDRVSMMLPNQAVKVGYLLDLSRSEFGEKYQKDVLKRLMDIVQTISSLSELMPPDTPNDEIVRAVEDLRHRISSDALGQEIGALIGKKLDSLLKSKEKGQKKASVQPAPQPAAPKQPAKGELGIRTLKAGEFIFNEGDAGDEAFMITSGEVEISIKSGENTIILATLGRGQIIGEMALIDDQPRMASAKAMAETVLSVIPQEAFKKRLNWLAEEDRLISHLLEIFVGRLRDQARNL